MMVEEKNIIKCGRNVLFIESRVVIIENQNLSICDKLNGTEEATAAAASRKLIWIFNQVAISWNKKISARAPILWMIIN